MKNHRCWKNGLFSTTEWKDTWGKENNPLLTIPKAGMHLKVVLCIRWKWKGIMHCMLLQNQMMLNSDKYSSQLKLLKAVINEKHLKLVNQKCIVFYLYNTRPHNSLQTSRNWLGSPTTSIILLWPCTFRLFWNPAKFLS